MAKNNKVFTIGQVADICCVCQRTAQKWFDKGLLRGYKIPGSKDRRVTRNALVEFLKENGMEHFIDDIPK